MRHSTRTNILLATLAGGTMFLALGSAPAAGSAPGLHPASAEHPVSALRPASAVSAASALARYKARHDTDPHIRLSAADRRLMKHRTARARLHLAHRQSRRDRHGTHLTAATTAVALPGTQQAQQNSYWCGPAAVSGAVAARGRTLGQSAAAGLLRTSFEGTAWSGTTARVPASYRTGYPVADVLSYTLRDEGARYQPAALPYAPTKADKATFRQRLVGDIDRGFDIVGDAWEVPGGPHLVGHPGNQEIFHFFTIRGYSSSGAYTRYQDSVHGAGSISWSSGVPAYSTMSSDTIVTINGGRGYIW